MDYIICEDAIDTIWSLWKNLLDQEDARISMESIEKGILPHNIEEFIDKDGYLPAMAIKPQISFSEIKAGENALEKVFDEIRNCSDGIRACGDEAIINGALLLDSIYHTQTYDSLHFAFELQELLKADDFALLKKIRSATIKTENHTKVECIDAIASLKVKEEGRKHAYSFATKFCNWVNRDAFPIFDSYVAWLLHYYLHRDKAVTRFAFTQTSYGSYDKFLAAYKYFRDNLIENGKRMDYKKLDVFMWTMGKIIDKQASVTYLPLRQGEQ